MEGFDLTMNDEVLFQEDSYLNSPPPSFVDALDTMDISDKELPISNQSSAKKDYTLVPMSGSFITATCPRTGKPIFFSKKAQSDSKRKMDTLFKEITSNKGHSRGLLMKPIWQLRKEIEEKHKKELRRIDK